jgi:hypothetical protein
MICPIKSTLLCKNHHDYSEDSPREWVKTTRRNDNGFSNALVSLKVDDGWQNYLSKIEPVFQFLCVLLAIDPLNLIDYIKSTILNTTYMPIYAPSTR